MLQSEWIMWDSIVTTLEQPFLQAIQTQQSWSFISLFTQQSIMTPLGMIMPLAVLLRIHDSFYLQFHHCPAWTHFTYSSIITVHILLSCILTLCFYIITIQLSFVKPLVTSDLDIGNPSSELNGSILLMSLS